MDQKQTDTDDKKVKMSVLGSNGNITCGVLFCGGCNPRYDRLKLYQSLKAELQDLTLGSGEHCNIELEYFQDDKTYDITLLINGCSSECLMNDQDPGRLVLLNSGNQEEAIWKFRQIIEWFVRKNMANI